MLVLSRKRNERVLIGGASVAVLAINGQQVKLGIEAPRHVPVLRDELGGTMEVPDHLREIARAVGLADGVTGEAIVATVRKLSRVCGDVRRICEETFVDPEDMAPEWVEVYRELGVALGRCCPG